MPTGVYRNRVRVRVRSCCHEYNERIAGYFAKILQYVGQSEAREMCDEDASGERLFLREPVAVRLSPKKAPLTDIRLLLPASEASEESHAQGSLTARDARANGFAKAFKVLGGPEISIRALDRAEAKVAAWPEVYDQKAVTICAGKVHGVTTMEREQLVSL